MSVARPVAPPDAPPGPAAAPSPAALPRWSLRGRPLLPVVQGGMGVGVSASRLAGAVARLGAMGTISSVDLRHHHPDLLSATSHLPPGGDTKARVDAANLEALRREVTRALAIADGRGVVAVNVMRAVEQYVPYVRTACEAGAQAIVVGAGLPLDLPELAREHPGVALVPILSDLRGIQLVVKKWERKGRLPDAIVVEHPKHAGGHLGATRLEELDDPRFAFESVIPAARAWFEQSGLGADAIPLVPAGGIASHAQVRALLALGAAAVQLGTAFAVTEEGDAHPAFKAVLAGARPEDIVEFLSVAGLPARAVRTPWLEHYLQAAPVLQAKAAARGGPKPRCVMNFDCLAQCGLRDGLAKFGQFCIDRQLAAAVHGDVRKGLFFRGAGPLPFGDAIRPVADLLGYLVTGERPEPGSGMA